VPRIVQLGRDPDLLARHSRVLDALPDLALVAVRERRVDVAVAGVEGGLDGVADGAGFGLPSSCVAEWLAESGAAAQGRKVRTEANCRNLGAGIELEFYGGVVERGGHSCGCD
jgi:hypothetical protein